MNYYAVIDTNVLVSALLKSASIPGIVARESLEGQIIPLLNDEIIAEYRAVLSRLNKRPSTANLCWAFLMPPSKPVGAADLCGPLTQGSTACCSVVLCARLRAAGVCGPYLFTHTFYAIFPG